MGEQQVSYTTINHIARKQLGLTMHEYALADLIYNLANNPESSYPGWCFASRQTLGDMLDLSERSIRDLISKLEAKKLVEKHAQTKHLRPTADWYSTVVISQAEESSAMRKKVPVGAEESSAKGAEESSDYKDIIYKDNNNVISKDITEKSWGNPDINEVSEYFLKALDIPKEDCTRSDSRKYWHLLVKESKSGVAGVKWLVDLVAKDRFYRSNITSSKDLYYKRVKIIARQRGKSVRVAVMGGKEEANEAQMENNSRHQPLLAK